MLRPLTLTLLILSVSHIVESKVIAVSNLQKCINTGSTTDLDCDKKIIVTLTIENNKLYQTELLNFQVSCINSPTGQCPCPCYYLDDPTCRCRDLAEPIQIGLTKTPVYALYPLSQPHTVNGRPNEAYITTGPGGSVGSCNDDENDANLTCGWATAPDDYGVMQKVRDSQGFCCKCPSAGGSAIPRGNRGCNWSPSWLINGAPGSAHCMRYDDYWWYRSYRVGQYQLDFDIQVHINTTSLKLQNNTQAPPQPPEEGDEDTQSDLEIVSLNPSRMSVLSSNKAVGATLLGDLDSYRQIQVLDGYYVMIPLQPGLDPNQVFTSNLDMWVIFPPDMVTSTGECDKIGIDYTGFRYQTMRCSRPVGSCLSKQIYDLGIEDEARIRQGLEPLYNITRYGGGTQNKKQVTVSGNGSGLALRLPLKGVKTSLVTLEIKADNVTLVANRAPAKIVKSEVCTFDGVICGGFQAIATQGFLNVAVNNTGNVPAEFRAGVVDCSEGVLPVQEEIAAIPPGRSHNFTFDLFMETDQAGNRSCTVVVTDSEGSIADSTIVNFYTNATQYEQPPDQSDLGNKPRNPGGPPANNSCGIKCPNVLNLACSLRHGCFKRVLMGLLAYVLLVMLASLIWIGIKKGWFCKIFKCCVGGCAKRGKRQRTPSSQLERGGSQHVAMIPALYPPPIVSTTAGGSKGNIGYDFPWRKMKLEENNAKPQAEAATPESGNEVSLIGVYPGGSIYSPDTTFFVHQQPVKINHPHRRTSSGPMFYNMADNGNSSGTTSNNNSSLHIRHNSDVLQESKSLREMYRQNDGRIKSSVSLPGDVFGDALRRKQQQPLAATNDDTNDIPPRPKLTTCSIHEFEMHTVTSEVEEQYQPQQQQVVETNVTERKTFRKKTPLKEKTNKPTRQPSSASSSSSDAEDIKPKLATSTE